MQRFMLKSKIHRGRIQLTSATNEWQLIGERVHVLNINNGERLITYTTAAPRGSGTLLLNGPAARWGMVGDRIIILSYCQVSAEKANDLKARVVFTDDNNKPKE